MVSFDSIGCRLWFRFQDALYIQCTRPLPFCIDNTDDFRWYDFTDKNQRDHKENDIKSEREKVGDINDRVYFIR